MKSCLNRNQKAKKASRAARKRFEQTSNIPGQEKLNVEAEIGKELARLGGI